MTNYFNGYIEVDSNTNIVIGIYDASDLNTNLIYPLLGSIIPPNPNIFGFANYQNNVLYDDAYKSIWQQFDTYGLIMKANNNINSSFYNSDYSYYNFYATSDPTANNGLIIGFDATGTTSIPRQIISSLTPVDNPICFNKDTKILCLQNDIETYIKIQDILEGTLVKTYKHDYKKVKKIHKGILRNNPKKPFSCMYKMKKTYNMIDDLIVTGRHSILVDKLSNINYKDIIRFKGNPKIKIDDKYLILACVSDKFEQIKDNKLYEYYHLSLESDIKNKRYGIYANGVLTETTFS